MAVVAKFRVNSISKAPATRWEDDGSTKQVEASTVTLYAVTDGSKENKEFFTNTPTGKIEIATINPAAAEQFKEGQEVYVTFTPAPVA